MVSWVVKVLETTITRVSAGSRSDSAKVISAGSTLAANRTSIDASSGRSASQTSLGPKSEPPIPMCTILRNGRPVAPRRSPFRIRAAKSAIRPRTVSTSAETGSPWARNAAPFGARSAICNAARPSEAFMVSPAKRRSRAPSIFTARAKPNAAPRSLSDQGCLERSSSRPAADRFSCASLVGSAANRSTIRRPRAPAAAASRPAQAALRFGVFPAKRSAPY